MTFEEVLNNEDCISIMNSIAKRYKGLVSRDEIKSFKLESAWEASEKYDPNHPGQMKFTTYLANCLKFKILLYLRGKKIKKNWPMQDKEDSKDYTFFTDMIDCLDAEEKNIFILKYIENYSTQELADKQGVSRQSIKNRLDKIKNKLAEQYKVSI